MRVKVEKITILVSEKDVEMRVVKDLNTGAIKILKSDRDENFAFSLPFITKERLETWKTVAKVLNKSMEVIEQIHSEKGFEVGNILVEQKDV